MIPQHPEPTAPWLLPEHIVSGTELRRLLGNITRATLIAWRRDRGFPEPVKQLEREAVWDIREVRAWTLRSKADAMRRG
jgi:predicted DNA-binding transcriptional regulator AlpA